MKKTLVVLAALAATSAFAQSTATITGTMSVGITDSGQAGTGLGAASLGAGANAINLNTKEDLGGGNAAGFDSQIRFNAGTGNVVSGGTAADGTSLFHTANVYLSGAYGTVRAGKIGEDSSCAFDPWGCTGGASLVAGAAGSIGANGAGLVGAQAIAAAVGYTTPVFQGFSANLITGTLGAATAHERKQIAIKYENGPIAAQLVSFHGSANTAAANAAPAANNAERSITYGASYDFGVAKVMASRSTITTDANDRTHAINAFGVAAPITPVVTLLAGYSKNGGSAVTDATDTKTSVGVNYALSKRTTLGADLYKNEAWDGIGYVARMRHTF